MLLKLSIISILILGAVAEKQGNAGSNVAQQLLTCYNNTYFKSRESRLPATINVLIDLIRQIEDGKSREDARVLSIGLIHRFRQDGIRREDDEMHPASLPYSPRGYQVFRNRVILQTLLPGSQAAFPNETLNDFRTCSLHYLVSNTFETRQRGDEALVCGKLGRYTKRIYKRAVVDDDSTEAPKDVEKLTPRGYSTKVNMSECPVESGVIYTKFGAVQIGTVLTAIAAGLEPQTVPASNGKTVDNVFGVTLAGDIAETAFLQGMYNNFDVGNAGGFNSTLVPRWYFMENRGGEIRSMTDADINGDLDGLILGKNVQQWVQRTKNLKVSQLLDMYYSPRGVFSSDKKACNRNKLQTDYVKMETLKEQSLAYAYYYDREGTFKGSVPPENFQILIDPVIQNYLQIDKLNQPLCPSLEENKTRVATDLIIVLDLDWPFQNVYTSISYLLDHIDINKYESNVTIVNAKDGSVIVPQTNTILDYHEFYNQSVHDSALHGTDLLKSMRSVEDLLTARMEVDKAIGRVGSKSQIVLFVLHDTSIPRDASEFVSEKIRDINRKELPDVRFMAMARGITENYKDIVTSEADIFNLQETANEGDIAISIDKLINRITLLPRRVSNPKCGSQMSGDTSNDKIDLSAEPETTTYYRIAPNYFYGEEEPRIRLRAKSPVTVCVSRTEQNPKSGNADCSKPVIEHFFELREVCDSVENCAPFYFSLTTGTSQTYDCEDCRFPDGIKYTLSVEGLGCHDSAATLFSSLVFLTIFLYFF